MKNKKISFKKISGGEGSAPALNLLLQGELLALTVDLARRRQQPGLLFSHHCVYRI